MRRLASLVLPHWRMALLGILLSLLALLANMTLLALSSWFIASMALAGSLGATMDYTTPAAAIRGLALARAGGRYAERLANHATTLRILGSLRVWFFQRIEPLAPARLAAHRGGDLLARIRSDVDSLDDFYVRGLVPTIAAGLAVLCLAPFLARFDARVVAVDLGGLCLGGVLLPLLLRTLADEPGRGRVADAGLLRALVVEQAQGMAELVALGAIEEHTERIVHASRSLDARQRRLGSLQGVGEAGLVAASSLATWATAALVMGDLARGALPPVDLAVLTVLVLASFEIVMPLPGVIQRFGEMKAAAQRLFDLIDTPPAVVDQGDRSWPASNAPVGVAIHGLRFRYDAAAPLVFDGLAMDVEPGVCTAIAGPSGCGKSTLVSLLLRFWEYEAGSVTIRWEGASAELRELAGDDARRLFSVLPQSPYLFHASIRENLLLASQPDREPGDGDLLEALRAAELGALMAALPDGLDTTVGEQGRELSAGEARRVALARMFLRDAPIYVLDEPTEGLDPATADAVLFTLRRRLRGRTVILMSHRDRDLSIADRVVRLPGPPIPGAPGPR